MGRGKYGKTNEIVTGAVLKFDEEKGFGFIKPERGNEDLESDDLR